MNDVTAIRATPVSVFMTPHVKSVPQNWTMQRFATFLSDNNITGSPVTNDNGDVVGIATLKDIADFHFNATDSQYETQLTEDELREARRLKMLLFEGMSKHPVEVRDIMAPIVFSVQEDSTLDEVARLMMDQHLHRVFVKKDDKITGIITTYDLLKVITGE